MSERQAARHSEAQRSHACLILVWTLDHSQFAEILAGIERQLDRWPSGDDRPITPGSPGVIPCVLGFTGGGRGGGSRIHRR